MIKSFFVLLISIFLFQGCVKSKAKEIEKVSVSEMQTQLQYNSEEKNEIKSKEDFKSSHLINAEEVLNNSSLRKSLKDLDKTAPIAIFYTSDNKTAEAAVILQDLGFQQIYILDGGIKKWIQIESFHR